MIHRFIIVAPFFFAMVALVVLVATNRMNALESKSSGIDPAILMEVRRLKQDALALETAIKRTARRGEQ